jgi:membrane fusion protein (multidrug efflux system)
MVGWRAALLLSALLLACGGEREAERPPPPVSLARVVALDLVDHIEATGELLAVEEARIAAEVGGRITEVLVDEGSPVEGGVAVMTVDPERRALERDAARARVDEAEANLRDAQREYGRVKDLRERKVASQTQLDNASTALELARSRLAAARADLGVMERALSDANVTAPFAGLIARRFVSRGEYVQPGTELFELVALHPIEVEFHVAELDSSRVAVGQTVDVRLAPFPDETFGATVTFVSPTIDTRTRTLRVKAQLDNSDGRLRPGLFARVDLGVSERRGVPMVPEEAVLQRADGSVVFRMDEGDRVERRVVETGVHKDGQVEIVHGVEAGDLVVSRGQTWLSDGDLVTPRRPDGTLATSPLPSVAGEAESREALP